MPTRILPAGRGVWADADLVGAWLASEGALKVAKSFAAVRRPDKPGS